MKLHPLHTPELLFEHAKNCGEYFPTDRQTGRSTAMALDIISMALKNPHYWIEIKDHHHTYDAHRNLTRLCMMMVNALGLKHFQFNEHNVCFTNIPNYSRKMKPDAFN